MFCTLFSLLVVLFPAAAAAWFIQADAPDRPTVVSTVRSCDTPYRLTVYDDISSKKNNRYDTAFLHPYNPFFVPADMIELDIPLGVLSKQPLSTMEFLDRLLLANLRLRLLIEEYEDLQERAKKLLNSIAVPYFETPEGEAMTVDDRKHVAFHKKKLESRLTGIFRYGVAVSSTASSAAVPTWQDVNRCSSILGDKGMSGQNPMSSMLNASMPSRNPSVNQDNYRGRDVDGFSLGQSGEARLPWIFRVAHDLFVYTVSHKVEVLFYGILMSLVCCFISLQAKA